jgi:hypothetical protein
MHKAHSKNPKILPQNLKSNIQQEAYTQARQQEKKMQK